MNIIDEITQNQVTKQPEAIDAYPEHHALWFLDAVGIFDHAYSQDSTAWDAAASNEPVTVALIDTPVAWDHPCLQEAVDRVRMIDFSVDPKGQFPVPLGLLSEPEQAQRTKLLQELGRVGEEQPADTAARPALSGHGTAMAGLIGGRPKAIRLQVNARYGRAAATLAEADERGVTLPYAGVNPFCRIVPISTTSDPDPLLLKNAFDYATRIGADVIVFATSLIAPGDVMKLAPPTSGGVDDDRYTAEKDARVALEKAIIGASANAWVVCAAGNSGRSEPDYPASLSDENTQIVAVGALTSDNLQAPYSSGADVWGPSNDEEGFDTDSSRRDRYRHSPQGWPKIVAGQRDREVSVFDLVTTDVPGPFGYNPATTKYIPGAGAVHQEIGSLFCRFGGTSGATAVVAGLIALKLQTGKSVGVAKKGPKRLLTLQDLDPPV
ncbi:MAG: S8 family serine peptidase [Rhodobacteraceae bacterium]|nr:S8 family serine peptidase [Paracoccaceae bacterium]